MTAALFAILASCACLAQPEPRSNPGPTPAALAASAAPYSATRHAGIPWTLPRHHTATPLTILDRAAYLRTSLESEVSRPAILRLALDDWAIVWLNGEKVAALRHDEGLRIARIPVTLRQGRNELRIKTNNTDAPRNKRLWLIHSMIEP